MLNKKSNNTWSEITWIRFPRNLLGAEQINLALLFIQNLKSIRNRCSQIFNNPIKMVGKFNHNYEVSHTHLIFINLPVCVPYRHRNQPIFISTVFVRFLWVFDRWYSRGAALMTVVCDVDAHNSVADWIFMLLFDFIKTILSRLNLLLNAYFRLKMIMLWRYEY